MATKRTGKPKGLTKKAYKEIVDEQILQTGEYAGIHVEEVAESGEGHYYLNTIKEEYMSGVISLDNADCEIAKNYLMYTSEDYYDAYDALEDLEDINNYLKDKT